MVDRVEEEYDLADWVRVSSDWARDSLIRGGVSPLKIKVFPQPVDLRRFHTSPLPTGHASAAGGGGPPAGPLRVRTSEASICAKGSCCSCGRRGRSGRNGSAPLGRRDR